MQHHTGLLHRQPDCLAGLEHHGKVADTLSLLKMADGELFRKLFLLVKFVCPLHEAQRVERIPHFALEIEMDPPRSARRLHPVIPTLRLSQTLEHFPPHVSIANAPVAPLPFGTENKGTPLEDKGDVPRLYVVDGLKQCTLREEPVGSLRVCQQLD